MELFDAHQQIINQYSSYIESFIFIADERIKQRVAVELGNKKLWPEPLIQFNPGCKKELPFKTLCSENVLHSELTNIFDFTPHKHQELAFRLGTTGKSFVVTSELVQGNP